MNADDTAAQVTSAPQSFAVPPPLPLPEQPRTIVLWFELAAVLALAVVPDIAWAVMSPGDFDVRTYSIGSVGIYLLIRSAQVVLPLLYILSMSAGGPADIGLVHIQVRDLPWGVAIWIASIAAFYGLWYPAWIGLYLILPDATYERLHEAIQQTPKFAYPTGAGAFALLVVASFANGFAEELVMRAYLITRLRQLLGSWTIAILISATLFAAYHAYQGPAGVISSLAIGAIFGIAFAWLRRLWPLAIAHALTDVAGWLWYAT